MGEKSTFLHNQTWKELTLRSMFKLFAFLYMFAPLIAVPSWAYSNDNWYLLFGIPFSYFGSYTSFSPRLKIFIYLYGILCFEVWIVKGFNVHQYITFFFFCSLYGYLMARIAEKYDQQSKEGTLENDAELSKFMNDNPEYLQEKIKKWREENPGKECTFDVIDSLARGKEKAKQKVISQICSSAEDYLDRGRLKIDKEDFEGAIKDYTKAIELNDLFYQAYAYRGMVRFLVRDFKGSIEDFDKTIKLDPQNENVYQEYKMKATVFLKMKSKGNGK